jgi:hypothetical protein
MLNEYDYIIIGGGIAGLYANYKLANKNLNGLLFEKEDYFGGRIKETLFHGSIINLGAGIIPINSYLVINLVNKLKLKTVKFSGFVNSLLNYDFDMNKAINNIIQKYKENKNNISNLNTIKFLQKYFDKLFIKQFIENCEYHDFLYSDISYFIKYYDIRDMTHDKRIMYGIVWKDLINKLLLNNCSKNKNITKIEKYNKNYKVYCNNHHYITKKVILATTLYPTDKLLKNIINFKYSDYLGSVPFTIIYTYHKDGYNNASTNNLSNYNLVPNELQKILKITNKILMISYSDDKDALFWKKIINLSKSNQIKLIKSKLNEININIEIDDIYIQFWAEGVHYYKPFNNNIQSISFNSLLKKLGNPTSGIKVVGEMVSKKHGWVEGAIESVNRALL